MESEIKKGSWTPESVLTLLSGKYSIFLDKFLITVPGMPESEMRTLLPLPRIVKGSEEYFLRISINSSVVSVVMKVSAGPPILTVV
jgi:hypothetical protein